MVLALGAQDRQMKIDLRKVKSLNEKSGIYQNCLDAAANAAIKINGENCYDRRNYWRFCWSPL